MNVPKILNNICACKNCSKNHYKAFVIIMNHVIQRSLIIFTGSGINIIQNLMLDIIKVNKSKVHLHVTEIE